MKRTTMPAVIAAALAALLAAGCAVSTRPLDAGERERLGSEAQRALFAGQEPIERPLTLAEATARAIKYQAEHRQRRMEEAAAAAQLDVAKFDLLPRMTANAGYSWRNNEAFGFGITPDGTITSTPSAAVERTHSTASVGVAWNLLDFGVSYFRAKQLSDQKLIAEERRRKAVQTLMHDVRVAWWRAEAAGRLLPDADRLLGEIDRAVEKTRLIEKRRLMPPVQTATLRRAYLDLGQQIALHRQDLAQARIELAALINAAPGAPLELASPPSAAREVPRLTADVEQLEALALRTRPEMAEEGYRARISADEARKALVSVLPGVNLDLTRNHDTNRFLVNNTWTSFGFGVALNLVKAFSLPALGRSEEAQRKADDARREALAMAVLAQTRLAATRYTLVADEFLIWDDAARDDDLIVHYLASGEKAGIDNELELVRARARAMASRINRDLAYANVQAAIGRLYNSVGFDAVPRENETMAVADLARLVDARFGELERGAFSPRGDAKKPAVSLDEISGADARVARLLREGVERVLASAGMKLSRGPADVRLALHLELGSAKEGKRAARVALGAPAAGSPRLAGEFKTTLSEPVDDEQWRVLGEGPAYRLLGALASAKLSGTALRISRALQDAQDAPGARGEPGLDGTPLGLRLDDNLQKPR